MNGRYAYSKVTTGRERASLPFSVYAQCSSYATEANLEMTAAEARTLADELYAMANDADERNGVPARVVERARFTEGDTRIEIAAIQNPGTPYESAVLIAIKANGNIGRWTRKTDEIAVLVACGAWRRAL